jgi:hypothetical protein
MPEPQADETTIPTHPGLALAALILGALCVPVAAYVGVQSLAVSLPVFGVWFFLPVVVLAIGLGMFAAHDARGVAGAALGVAALLVCLTFVLVDRLYGPEIRAQLRAAAAAPATPPINLEQLMKVGGAPAAGGAAGGAAASRPASP